MRHHLTAKLETIETNLIERTIGRAVSIAPSTEPFGPASEDLLGDVFHSLYNQEFVPLEDKDAPKTRRINHALMKWMGRDQGFMAAREKTSGKLAHSLVASKLLYEYLITDDAIRQALEVQEEPPKRPEEGMVGGSGRGNGQGKGGFSKEQADMREKSVQEALKKLQGLEKNIIGSQIMTSAARKAEEKVDKVDAAMRGWGLEAGDVSLSNIDEIMKMVDSNSSKMERISELAGRFESIAAKALEKVRESYIGQIVDTRRTTDFTMMYGSEICYLLSPDVPQLIHALYAKDYLDDGLLGVEVRAEGKEFGALCIMVDGSGSMSDNLEIPAKAIALGLARALNRDSLNNREYVLNTFGSGGDGFFTVRSDQSWKDHFDWASLFHGGGTDFDYSMRKAMEQIKDMPEGTDLVFITDGACQMHSGTEREWKQFKDEHGTRLLYIDVSGGENRQLRLLSDMYMSVSTDGANIEVLAEDIAGKLAENMESARLRRLDVESDT